MGSLHTISLFGLPIAAVYNQPRGNMRILGRAGFRTSLFWEPLFSGKGNAVAPRLSGRREDAFLR